MECTGENHQIGEVDFVTSYDFAFRLGIFAESVDKLSICVVSWVYKSVASPLNFAKRKEMLP